MEGSRFGGRKRTLVSYQRDRLNEKGRANRRLPGIAPPVFVAQGPFSGAACQYRDLLGTTPYKIHQTTI
jgi:hypothetical protein